MGRRQRNNHPNKYSKAKRKKAPIKGSMPQRNALTGIRSHAASNPWIQGSTFLFLGFVVLFGVAIVTSKDIKAATIAVAISGTLLLWIVAAVVCKSVNENADPEMVFSILQTWFDGTDSPNSGLFWIRYPSSLGDTLSPASAAMFITIKNPRTSPVRIERLELSVQKRGGRWVSLRFIPTEGNRLYWIHGDLAKSLLIEVPLLDKEVHSSIPPGETVPGGWMFWSLTKAVPLSQGDEVRWRLRANDSGGEQSEFISEFGAWTDRPDFDTGMKQPILIKPLEYEDLSSLARRIFAPFKY